MGYFDHSIEYFDKTELMKHNRNTLFVSYIPNMSQTYKGALARLIKKYEDLREEQKDIDSFGIYRLEDPEDKDRKLVLLTSIINESGGRDLNWGQLEDLLCDLQGLPVMDYAPQIKKVVYRPLNNMVVAYRGIDYPNRVFRKEDKSILQEFINSLRTLDEYPRIEDAVQRIINGFTKHEKYKHIADVNVYVTSAIPGISSMSSRMNDTEEHAIPELKNTVMFHPMLDDTSEIAADQQVLANVARALCIKALQKYSHAGMPTEKEVNLALSEVFGFSTGYYCPNCNGELHEDYIACPKCGARLVNSEEQKVLESARRKFTKYYPQNSKAKESK